MPSRSSPARHLSGCRLVNRPSPARPRLKKRIPDSDALEFLSVAEIFREEFRGLGRYGGSQDESVPEGKLVENTAVDSFLDDRWGELYDVEEAEVAEVLPGLQRLDPELAGRGRVEFLEHLS